MHSTMLITFCAALLAGAATPGPAITAVVARVLGRGASSVVSYVFGIILADLIWLTLAIAGTSVVARSFAPAVEILRYCGAGYLLYLAYGLWTTPVGADPILARTKSESSFRSGLAGLALELGNPKTMTFYVALLPNLIEMSQVAIDTYAVIFASAVAIYAAVFGGYILLAARSRRLFRSDRAMTLMSRGAGAAMAGAAIVVAAR